MCHPDLVFSPDAPHESPIGFPASLLFGCSCLLLCTLLPIFLLLSDLSKILTSADQHSAQTLPLPAAYIQETGKHSCLHSNRQEKMPLVEYTYCMNCHRLLQRIVVYETMLLAGFPKQVEHTADHHHGVPSIVTSIAYCCN